MFLLLTVAGTDLSGAEALSERAVAGAKLLMELSALCCLHSALQL